MEGSCPVCRPHRSLSPMMVKRRFGRGAEEGWKGHVQYVGHIGDVLQKYSRGDSGAERRSAEEGWKEEGSYPVCRPHR